MDEWWADLLTGESPVADPAILAELERRMAPYQAHPETAVNWETVRTRLFGAG